MKGGSQLKAPIFLVGSPRSGTTLLGQLLSAHPQVAYWEEPRPIWSLGNAYLPDDVLDETHARPSVASKIDRHFAAFLRRSGKPRFMEKTPSNMLRLRFVHQLYPNGRIIHILRDGRAVVASSQRMLAAAPRMSRIMARLRETPLESWPALVPVFYRDVIQRKLRGGQKAYWGPRPPGWQDWLDLPAPVILARQWAALVTRARQDLAKLPPGTWMEFKYEDLLSRPAEILPQMLEFAGLPPREEVTELASRILDADRIEAWREDLDPDTLALIEPELQPLLAELDYAP